MNTNRGYEGASVPVGNPLEPAPPRNAELRAWATGVLIAFAAWFTLMATLYAFGVRA